MEKTNKQTKQKEGEIAIDKQGNEGGLDEL